MSNMSLYATDGEVTFKIPWSGVVPRRGDYFSAEDCFNESNKKLEGVIDKVVWEYPGLSRLIVTLWIIKEEK